MTIKNYNDLTPAQTERLAYLIEECSEVQHIACKILRHGYSSYDPTSDKSITNRDLLHKELADLYKAIRLMYRNNDISEVNITEIAKHSTYKYMHHQKDMK